jgi:hypothetical protein
MMLFAAFAVVLLVSSVALLYKRIQFLPGHFDSTKHPAPETPPSQLTNGNVLPKAPGPQKPLSADPIERVTQRPTTQPPMPPTAAPANFAHRSADSPSTGSAKTTVGGIAFQERTLTPPLDFAVRDGTLANAPPQRDFDAMRRRFVEVPIKPVRMQQTWGGFGGKGAQAGMETGGLPSEQDEAAMAMRAEGVQLFLRGDAAAAVEHLETALAKAETDYARLRIEWVLARAYARNGQIKESQHIYEKLAAR